MGIPPVGQAPAWLGASSLLAIPEVFSLTLSSAYNGRVRADQNQDGAWTLLTGHGHVLVEIARNPRARLREIADVAGITERAVQGIVSDLEQAGYLRRERHGRRNRYTVNTASLFRHPAQSGHRVGAFLAVLAREGDPALQSGAASENGNGRGGPQLSASTGKKVDPRAGTRPRAAAV